MDTTPKHLTSHAPTGECPYCDHVLICQPGFIIAKNARLRHARLLHPNKPRIKFSISRKKYQKTDQLHAAVRNRSAVKYLSARATTQHNLGLLRTLVWPWTGPIHKAKRRPQTRTFWYCLKCAQSFGNSGHIQGVHIAKTPCAPCPKRNNLKMSLRQWAERIQWLKKAKASTKLAQDISIEAIQVATQLVERTAQLFVQAPVPRSVLHKEMIGGASQLPPAAQAFLTAARTRADQQ